MGAGQSVEETRRLDNVSDHIKQSSTDAHPEADVAPNPQEPAAELPQRRMADKKVDDMCFMISCTNWY